MKDQYFGDINDYRKYGLLRVLGLETFRVGVCWMLTAPDGRPDGRFINYLTNPRRYRGFDSILFDWLHRVVCAENDRRTARLEESGLLGKASFHSELLRDASEERELYIVRSSTMLKGCDLVFFDPDNGLEIQSKPLGRRNSCKYLYWNEVCETFGTGSSVLIYQHFPRQGRAAYIARKAADLRERLPTSTVFSFTMPNVLGILAAQKQHNQHFRRQIEVLRLTWPPRQIEAIEHPTPLVNP